MNIIFGKENLATLDEKYTVLELDTVRIGVNGPEVAAFCIVESVPILKMPKVVEMKNLHQNLLIEYQRQNWTYCEQALEHLVGFWGNDVDTFYDSIRQRIEENKSKTLEGHWWIIHKE